MDQEKLKRMQAQVRIGTSDRAVALSVHFCAACAGI
jgi:hypothetical protein